MSRLVLEILSHSGDGGIMHRTLERFPATLGRGYHNDVILSDPHVSPNHLRFDHGAEGWTVTDLGSDNGLIVNDQVHRSTAQLASGDVVFTHGATLARFTSSLANEAPVVAPQGAYAGAIAETVSGDWLVSERAGAGTHYAIKLWKPGSA